MQLALVKIARIANGGRSFEYISGEDPYLGYQLLQPVIQGIQSKHVIANVKHYINNRHESNIWPYINNRNTIWTLSKIVRTLNEKGKREKRNGGESVKERRSV